VLTVKNNQPTLHAQLATLFSLYGQGDYQAANLKVHKTIERGHGRQERREYYVAPAPDDLKQTKEWKNLRSVGMVYRCREHQGKLQEEVVYFISSLPPRVKRLARLIRNHWGIENSLHWNLDVTFGEDQSRLRKGTGQEIAGVFRRLALSVLQQDTTVKSSIRGKRLMAGWNTDMLESILTCFDGK
jgi:predicted transposase YbfD/YdcC